MKPHPQELKLYQVGTYAVGNRLLDPDEDLLERLVCVIQGERHQCGLGRTEVRIGRSTVLAWRSTWSQSRSTSARKAARRTCAGLTRAAPRPARASPSSRAHARE